MNTLENLKWRYATKKFNPSKKIASTDLQKLKEAVQISPTSYGLQLFKVLDIQDESLRKALQLAAWGQSQITDADRLFVFCSFTEYNDTQVDDYISLVSDTRGIPSEHLKGYGDFMKSSISTKSKDDYKAWTAKQTYIPLANLMTAAAELKIDVCPMEGFDAEKFNEILGLSQYNLTATVIAAIGYRSEEDDLADKAKVRKAIDELFMGR